MNRLERKKIIQVILGTSMIALAITLLITAHKGADTISVFLLGMLTLIDIPFWVASLLFNAVVLGIVAIFNRKELGIGSLINGFGLGLLIGQIEPWLNKLSVNMTGYSIMAVLFSPYFIWGWSGIICFFKQRICCIRSTDSIAF